MKTKEIENTFFITHVHWDREWYWPVEKYRFRLFEVFDAMKQCLDRDDYHSFWLDGQMVFLEDYLEARPQDKELIKRWVKEGKLHIGPFYVLNDEQLPCGESQIRNYIIGIKIGNEFGPVVKVGYMSDNFGHMSQTPQLLQGFGIDNAVFGRGFKISDDTEDIATWEGADGTEVIAVLLSKHYSSCAGLDLNDEKSFEHALSSIAFLKKHCASGQLLLMYGIDHALPNPDTSKIIEKLTKLSGLKKITHSSFDEFLNIIRKEKPTYKLDGELMHIPHLDGTFSANIWQKALNRRAEKELIYYAEPLATIAEIMTDKEYPAQDFERSWKYLLRAHPHDSLPGCHADRVADDMRTRLLRSHDISSTIAEQSFDAIQKLRLDYQDPTNCKIINVFNPSAYSRTEIIRTEIFLPEDSTINTIFLKSADDTLYKATVIKNRLLCYPKRSDYMIPKGIPHQRVLIEFGPVELVPMGFTAFEIINKTHAEAGDILMGAVTGNTGQITISTAIQTAPGVLENEHIKATIYNNGKIDILNKENQYCFRNIHYIEAEQDAGSLYSFLPLIERKKYYIQTGKTELIRNSHTSATFMVDSRIDMPDGLDKDKKASGKIVSSRIRIFYTLFAGEKFLRIRAEIDNKANNALIRACLRTNLCNAKNLTHTPFDIVARPPLPDASATVDTMNVNRYVAGEFTSISDSKNGLAVINNGLPEYCFYENGQLDITLLRGSKYIWGNDDSRFPTIEFKSDNGQCLGLNVAEYALYPFTKSIIDGENLRTAFEYGITPLCRVGKEPVNIKGIEVSNPLIKVTAFKKAEDGNGYILRLVNFAETTMEFDIILPWQHATVEKVKLNETTRQIITLSNKTIKMVASPKEIITIRLTFH